MKNKTDEQLVILYRGGQADAFNELYSRYKNAIQSYAHSVYCIGADIEDVIQEGMVGLLNAINHYSESGKASFKTYAFLCIKTNIIKAVSRYFSNKTIPLNIAVSITDCENEINRIVENPEDAVIFKEKIELLLEGAKENLSAFEQKVLEKFLQGFSYMEIAQLLGCSPKKCDNALQRIKKKLTEED